MERRQAAVVFNDIQGYTSLMQENEAHAVMLRQRHKEVVDRLTRQFGGTIIQYYGDGTLSIFEKSLNAVECALEMQREFSQSPQIPLRIGINAGEVLVGPDGVYGDSVNVASRIERMSVPGSVLISQKVFEEIQRNGGVATKELGQFELKNVREPIFIHAVVSEGVKVPDPIELAGKIGFKEKTIMVLPFYNLSKNPENDFFSDGITEQVIYALSNMEGLRVVSRTSSFTFKDKQINLRQLYQEFGIDHILEGSVRRHGNKVRITAQLISAADDFHLWSETYNREVADVFQIQDEIAAMISNKLKASFQQFLNFSQAESPALTAHQPEAFEHYHKGRYFWKQKENGYVEHAIQSYQQAIKTDPNFYLAWIELAKANAYKGYYNLALSQEAADCCRQALEKADQLQPDQAQTHTGWALYNLFFTWDWPVVQSRLSKANARQDHDNFILFNAVLLATGIYNISANHFEEAISYLRKALKVDPLNLAIQMELARTYLYSRSFRKALDLVNQMIRLRPDYLPAYELKGWILFSMGHQREGIEEFEHFRNHSPLPIAGLAGLAYAYARTSHADKAAEVRELMHSVSEELSTYAPHYDLALAHLGAQEYEQMFDQLELAVEQRTPALIYLESNPIWDEIRRFNQYRALTNKIFCQHQRLPL